MRQSTSTSPLGSIIAHIKKGDHHQQIFVSFQKFACPASTLPGETEKKEPCDENRDETVAADNVSFSIAACVKGV
ncbi:MAG: hypothetical protein ACR2PF_15625 [Rhizobiaceae bacterium]